MSSNKTKNPIWNIVIIAVFGLLAAVALYNLYYLGYWNLNLHSQDPYEAEISFSRWINANNRLFLQEKPISLGHFIHEFVERNQMQFNRLLYFLSMLCLIAACVLGIITRDNKNKIVIIAFAAFAAIQLIYYGMEFIQIITIFIKRDIPLNKWSSYLRESSISHTYLWECLWRMATAGVILLYALKNFIPAIDNLLNGGMKKILLNAFSVLFLFSLAFLPFNTSHWVSNFHYEEKDFLCALPFYVAAIGLVCQSTIFIWFIKE